jgi:hypothetical protein
MLERVGAGVCTVSPVLPRIELQAAWIVVDPLETPEASPEMLIVATPVEVEFHVAVDVQFWVVPSEKLAVAVYWRVVLILIVLLDGVTVTLVIVGGGGPGVETVNVEFPDTAPIVAEMVLVPADSPVASPLELIEETVVFPEAHVGETQFLVDPSL